MKHPSRSPETRAATRRRRLATATRVAAVLAAATGVAFLAYPTATNLYQARVQARLVRQLASPELRQSYEQRSVAVGSSLTRLRIPAIGVDQVVVEGTSDAALRAGVGHYRGTALPGEDGNVAIAGHRTTYGRPFARLGDLRSGDEITFETPIGRHVYRVSGDPFVVTSSDWRPIAPAAGRTVTLSTCHPKGSARQRLVVQATLIPSPTGA